MDNLQRALNIALLEQRESDVSGFVLGILGMAEKDLLHGYFVRVEHHLLLGRADITVEVMLDEKKVLVIECKRSFKEFKQGEVQLMGYMMGSRYPNGLLICGSISKFYSLDTEDAQADIELREVFNNAISLDKIIKLVKEL